MLSESWPNQDNEAGLHKFAGFNSLRYSNRTRRGGGAATFYSTKINHELLCEKQEDNVQIPTTKLTLENMKNFLLTVLYRTQKSSACSFLNSLQQYLTHLNKTQSYKRKIFESISKHWGSPGQCTRSSLVCH